MYEPDEANDKGLIAYTIDINSKATGKITTILDQQEMERIINSELEGNTYSNIKNEATASVNKAMFGGVDYMTDTKIAMDNFDANSVVQFSDPDITFNTGNTEKHSVGFTVNQPPGLNLKFYSVDIYIKNSNNEEEVVYKSGRFILKTGVNTFSWDGAFKEGAYYTTTLSAVHSPVTIKVTASDSEYGNSGHHYTGELSIDVLPGNGDLKEIINEIFTEKKEAIEEEKSETNEAVQALIDEWLAELAEKGYNKALFAGKDDKYATPGFCKYFTMPQLASGTSKVNRYNKCYNKDLENLSLVLTEDWINKTLDKDNIDIYVEDVLARYKDALEGENKEAAGDSGNNENSGTDESTEETTGVETPKDKLTAIIEGDIALYLETQEIPEPSPVITAAEVEEIGDVVVTDKMFVIHSGSFELIKAKEQEISQKTGDGTINVNGFRGMIKNKVNDVDYKKLLVDVVYPGGSDIAGLPLKGGTPAEDNSEEIENNWFDKYFETDQTGRILFLMNNKGNKADKVYGSKFITDNQLPDIVLEYIQDQIMVPATSDILALKGGINAFKNAFDMRFKERLVVEGEKLLEESKYYKGYANITVFLYKLTSLIGRSDMPVFYYKDYDKAKQINTEAISTFVATENPNNEVTFPVVLYVKKGNKNLQPATIMDYLESDKLYYYGVNNEIVEMDGIIDSDILIRTNGEGDSYTQLSRIQHKNILCSEPYFDFSAAIGYINYYLRETERVTFSSIEDFTIKDYAAKGTHYKSLVPNLKKIDESDYHFKSWEGTGTPLKFYEAGKYCFTQTKLEMQVAKPGDDLTKLNWRSYYPKLKTWCNQYAITLSKNLYGKDLTTNDYPAPYGNGLFTANKQNDFFNSHSKGSRKVYEKIVNNDEDEDFLTNLWKEYINKGYPVYFSNTGSPGHIETGVPNNGKNKGNRMRYTKNFSFNYKIKDNANFKILGAGTYVGYKDLNNYDFIKSCEYFIYLGYLKNNFE